MTESIEIIHQVTDIHFDEQNSEAVAKMLIELLEPKQESTEGYEEIETVNNGLEYVIKFQFIHEWNRDEKPYEKIIHQDICIQYLRIYDTEGNRIKYTTDSDIEDIIKEHFTF